MEFAIFTPDKGPKRVTRTVYEACVFQALRDRLRCKEIWVVGADKWRDPDDDLPDDFEVRRAEYYEKLNKPRDARSSPPSSRPRCAPSSAPWTPNFRSCPWSPSAANTATGRSSSPIPSRRKSRRTCAASRRRFARSGAPVALIDILKEAALRTGMLKAMAPAGTREAINEGKLLECLLLIAYAYGTNSGISSVACGKHGHSEEDLRYTGRRYLTAVGLKTAGV